VQTAVHARVFTGGSCNPPQTRPPTRLNPSAVHCGKGQSDSSDAYFVAVDIDPKKTRTGSIGLQPFER